MKPFETLSKRGQLQRLRQVGLTALAAYEVPEPRLVPLHHIENTTFRVLAADQQQYVLRIQRPDSHAAAIRGEMAWLLALRRDTELAVPEPVPNRVGSFVTVAASDDMPEPRNCVLLRWLDGRFFDKKFTPNQLEQVGIFTAKLHEHAAHWQPPADFVRGRSDAITEKARRVLWQPKRAGDFAPQPSDEDVMRTIALVKDLFSTKDAEVIARVLQHIRTVFQQLGESKEVFGLIHADLHQANYLFQRGRACAIDFDDCGWGHYLFDLNVTLRELAHLPNYPSLRAALLAGYRSIRPLSADHERYLDIFFALRRIQLMIWVIESRDHPAFRARWVEWARNDLQKLAQQSGEND